MKCDQNVFEVAIEICARNQNFLDWTKNTLYYTILLFDPCPKHIV
jgi:hypothetical protein